MYRKFVDAVKAPVLANITEFGADAAVHASRSCAAPAWPGAVSAVGVPRDEQSRGARLPERSVSDGTQKNVVDPMQPRDELYDYLDYHDL